MVAASENLLIGTIRRISLTSAISPLGKNTIFVISSCTDTVSFGLTNTVFVRVSDIVAESLNSIIGTILRISFTLTVSPIFIVAVNDNESSTNAESLNLLVSVQVIKSSTATESFIDLINATLMISSTNAESLNLLVSVQAIKSSTVTESFGVTVT